MPSNIQDLLHPVRMRIIQTLMPDQRLTVQEIEEEMTDVPPATLYRHVNKLQEANFIEVVDQEKIRGTVKKTYAIKENAFQTPGNFQESSTEEHLQYFTMFMSFLQSEFKRYLDRSDKDFEADGVGYRYVSVYASDEEFEEWILTFRDLMKKLISNEKTNERKKRTIANIFIPTKE